MKIYCDLCCLQRTLDDKVQLRIREEADAVHAILARCDAGELELVASEVLEFEVGRSPETIREILVGTVLSKARLFIKTDAQIKKRATQYQELGIKTLDALHLASAVEAEVRFFLTCDDKLLKRAKTVDTGSTIVLSPIDLAEKL